MFVLNLNDKFLPTLLSTFFISKMIKAYKVEEMLQLLMVELDTSFLNNTTRPCTKKASTK